MSMALGRLCYFLIFLCVIFFFLLWSYFTTFFFLAPYCSFVFSQFSSEFLCLGCPFSPPYPDYWYPLCCAWIGCWKYQPYKDEHIRCFIGCCPTPFFFLLPAPDLALAQSSQVQGDGAVGALKCGPGMRTGESSNISFSGAKNKNVL